MSRAYEFVKRLRIVEDGLADPISRVFHIRGEPCVVRMERAFWESLGEAADDLNVSIEQLVRAANGAEQATIEAALRVMLIDHFRATRFGETGPNPPRARDRGIRVA